MPTNASISDIHKVTVLAATVSNFDTLNNSSSDDYCLKAVTYKAVTSITSKVIVFQVY